MPAVDEPTLLPLGWSQDVAQRWANAAHTATEAGQCDTGGVHHPPTARRVVRTSRRFTYVAGGSDVLRATAPVDLVPAPVTGDWVVVCPRTDGADPEVVAVAPRSTELTRSDPSGGSHHQVLAANVDVVLAVFGLDRDRKSVV